MEKKPLIFPSVFIPACLVLLLWCVWGVGWASDSDFYQLGILPRKLEGLPGILFSPLIHGSLNHLIDNSLPLFLLAWALFYFYAPVAVRVLVISWLIGGSWVWIGARTGAWHIGASGIVYSLASFLFFSGVFRAYPRLMAISLIVVFLYGSMIWGIFPFDYSISWEGHLFGATAGLLLAFIYRRQGPIGNHSFTPEEEEDAEDDPDAYWNQPDPESQK